MRREERAARAVAWSIARKMRMLGTGEMAALRRLDDGDPVPAYWRLAARHDVLHAERGVWEPIVQALAILTPKGRPENRGHLPNSKRGLGKAFCDGGRPDRWPGSLAPGASPRPMISEQRLAQLLAARGSQRSVLLLRAVRALAANWDARFGLDVGDLALRFIDTDPEGLALPYYQCLDRAERAAASDTSERTPDV
jgi:hypothetical protein